MSNLLSLCRGDKCAEAASWHQARTSILEPRRCHSSVKGQEVGSRADLEAVLFPPQA